MATCLKRIKRINFCSLFDKIEWMKLREAEYTSSLFYDDVTIQSFALFLCSLLEFSLTTTLVTKFENTIGFRCIYCPTRTILLNSRESPRKNPLYLCHMLMFIFATLTDGDEIAYVESESRPLDWDSWFLNAVETKSLRKQDRFNQPSQPSWNQTTVFQIRQNTKILYSIL